MKELDLPLIIKDRVEFYNKLWGKKVRGEDLASFSHLVSDSFNRKVVFNSSKDGKNEKITDLRKGVLVFTDKKRGLVLLAEVAGELEDLRDNIDTDKSNKNTSVFEFCRLDGEVHFETDSVVMQGFYRQGQVMGGFYEHIKSDKISGKKAFKENDIIRTIKQVYDREGRRHGVWYIQNKVRREIIAYDHGVLKPDAHKVEYFECPKTRTQKLIDGFLSIGLIANIARCISKRRALKNAASVKENNNQR